MINQVADGDQKIALMPLVRPLLKAAADGLTLSEMRLALLTAGVDVDAPELSSCMAKLMARKEVTRLRVRRPATGLGRGKVWRYRWRMA